MTEEQFLATIRGAFTEHSKETSDFLMLSGKGEGKFTFRALKQLLLGQFMEIIEYYFRTTTAGDENFFTEEEIEDVISHANRIMGTTLYVEFS